MLKPGWKYNLNVIKLINGTKNYLAKPDKDCQLESRDNCTTRSYVERVSRKCGCLPIREGFKNPADLVKSPNTLPYKRVSFFWVLAGFLN